MKIKKMLIVVMLPALILSSTGFIILSYFWDGNASIIDGHYELSDELKQSAMILSIGPPWYVLHSLNISTSFDERWAKSKVAFPESMPETRWQKMITYLKFLFAWYGMLLCPSIVGHLLTRGIIRSIKKHKVGRARTSA